MKITKKYVDLSLQLNFFIGSNIPLIGSASPSHTPSIGKRLPLINKTRARGFTLMELMVTLIVAAILGGLALPSVRTYIQNGLLTTQANNVLKDLVDAQEAARYQQKNVVICRSITTSAAVPSCAAGGGSSWETGWLVFVDYPAGGTVYNNVYLVADGDVLISLHPPLENGNTLRPNSLELADKIVFEQYTGKSTLNAVAAGNIPNHFKLCDTRGSSLARLIVLKESSSPTVQRGNKIVQYDNATAAPTTFLTTCP